MLNAYLHHLDWQMLPYTLVDGVCVGAIYALIALGYTMVYGIIKLINFAHGEFFMVGAYAGLGTYLFLPPMLPGWLTGVLVLAAGGLAGAGVAMFAERVAYRPIRDSSRLVALLTAIGISFLLQNLFTFVQNGNPLQFRRMGGAGNDPVQRLLSHSVLINGQGFATVKFSFLLITAVLMVGLWLLVMHTRFGRAMRATSQDMEAARLMGINVDRIILLTFAIGGFFAGIAGTLIGAVKLVEPFMGFMPGLIAFVAAVVGGIGSIPGAVLGGFLIGLLQQGVVWAGVPSGYMNVVTFFLLIVMLVVRPQGILGHEAREKV